MGSARPTSSWRYASTSEIKTVLILDDDIEMRRNTGTLLRRKLAVKVYEAATGSAGVELARRQPIDLALINLQLPDMSGLDVARALRCERIDVPWILMTEFINYDAALEAGKLGALRAVNASFDAETVVGRALDQVSKDRLWPSLPLAPRLTVAGTSAEHWAELVLRACDSDADPRTLNDWRLSVAVSYSTLTEVSRIIRIDPQSARDFMRILRALFRTDGSLASVEAELRIGDYRTRDRLFDRAGISRRQGRTRLSLQEYLYAQQFIRTGHPALGAIIRLLARA